MASTAPMVLFCDRCSSWRSEDATGSLAAPWARANVAQATRDTTTKVRFTGKPPEGSKDITAGVRLVTCEKPFTTGNTRLHREHRARMIRCSQPYPRLVLFMAPHGRKIVPL